MFDTAVYRVSGAGRIGRNLLRRHGALPIAAIVLLIGAGSPGAVAPAAAAIRAAAAVVPTLASSTQFDITGFLQSATLDSSGDTHSGGTVTINGQLVLVPRETVVILPANALTWQELFAHAPPPYGPTQSGMALSDSPTPLTTYEIHVVGNRVINAGGDRYVAGLVHIAQQAANTGTGYISYINYPTGELEVGGSPGVPGTGARVRINDPANPTALDENGAAGSGRYGRAMTPDARFQADQDNPTITAATGFPMCVPRVTADPNIPGNPDDPQCPQSNRPAYNGTDTSNVIPQAALPAVGDHYPVFRMDSPANVDAHRCVRLPCADPRKQAPFEVGDYITYSGTLVQYGGANGGQIISAHTITANLGIYTQQGTNPAYVSIGVSLIGTGGTTAVGIAEAATRTRFEGMTTDESRAIRVYGVDISPNTGVTTDRDWGSILPDPGPPAGAMRGRWRFRPPCGATSPSARACVGPLDGPFDPPTREVRAVISGLSEFLPGTLIPNPASQVPGTPSARTTANGLYYGQYHAPIGSYIFPENVIGATIPENNVNTLQFLAYGGYESSTGTRAGVLDPWPSSTPPPAVVCAKPTISGTPLSVGKGGVLQLSGSVTAGAASPVRVQWTAGTSLDGTNLNAGLGGLNAPLTNAETLTPTFDAVRLPPGQYFLAFTASNVCGLSTVRTTITVLSTPPTPAINPIRDQTVTAGLVSVQASSGSLPTPTWTWTELSGPATPTLVPAPAATVASSTSSLNFTASVAGTYTFGVTATNANGTSPPTTVTVVVTAPVPINVTLNTVYRSGKQRLSITATTTDTAVWSMILRPYMTESGITFDPATLSAAQLTISLTAPRTFTLTAVGVPRPACNLGGAYATPCAEAPLTVKAIDSSGRVTGTSVPSPLSSIRP